MKNEFKARSRQLCICAAAVVLLIAGACNTTPPPPETVVTGTVTFQGKPVTGGIVKFFIGEDRRQYTGAIYDNGTYEVTFIVPGDAMIAVDTGHKQGLPTYVDLPYRYTNPTKSNLKYTVVEGKNSYDIVLD